MTDPVEKKPLSGEEILEELNKEHNIDALVSFNEFNLGDKLSNISMVYVKYRDLLSIEKHQMAIIENFYEKVKGQKYEHYRFNYHQLLTPKEIEMYYLPKDIVLQNIRMAMMNQKVRVDFFDKCVKSIDKMSWSAKSFIDANKM